MKISIIKSDILQAGLYGSETSRASKEMIGKFKTAIAEAIGTKSQHRAQEIIFEINDTGKDIDPEIQILVRKVSLLRKIADKFPQTSDECITIAKKYEELFQMGVENPNTTKTNLNDYAKGPIGLLAEDLHKYGARLNAKLEIIQENELPISIGQTPWRELNRLVEYVGKRKRVKGVSQWRTCLDEVEEFDSEVFTKATGKRNPEELNILQYIMSLARFKGEDQVELGIKDQNKCSLCGEVEDNILHAL